MNAANLLTPEASIAPTHAVASNRLDVDDRSLPARCAREFSGPCPGGAIKPRVEWFHSIKDLPVAALDLMSECSSVRGSLQHSPDWFANLEDSVVTDRSERLYVCLYSDDLAVAVLPLLLGRKALHTQGRAMGNFYTCLFEPSLRPPIDSRGLVAMFQWLRASPFRLSSFVLSPLDADAPCNKALLNAMRLAGWKTHTFFCFKNWYLSVEDDWAGYLKSRSSKLRNTIKRMSVRLQEAQGSVEISDGKQDLAQSLAAYNEVYEQSWKIPEPFVGFMPGLVKLCAKNDALRIGIVRLQGKPIAAQIWIVVGQRAEIYKVAYDEEYKSYSPGTVLTARMIEHTISQDQVTEIDYLIGDDAYKKTWMGSCRDRSGILAFNPSSPAGLCLHVLEELKRFGRPWWRRIKSARRKAVATRDAAAGQLNQPEPPNRKSGAMKAPSADRAG